MVLKKLLRAKEINIDTNFEPQAGLPSAVVKAGTVYMSLEGALDAEKEINRLEAKLKKLRNSLAGIRSKLSNQSFINNAPDKVVEKERAKEKDLSEQTDKIEQNISLIRSLLAEEA